jgi:hypothetical protein
MPTKTLTAKKTTSTKTALPTLRTLPAFMDEQLGWAVRITHYLTSAADVRRMKADPKFSSQNGALYQIGAFQLREIGAYGSYDEGILDRIVEVTTPPDGEAHFPDLLGELCEDKTGPLAKWASPELRARLDLERFRFKEYGLIGDMPMFAGAKKRKDQLRIINQLAGKIAGKDREFARALALVLADNIDNLEPSEVL